jgi:hypothetical protein
MKLKGRRRNRNEKVLHRWLGRERPMWEWEKEREEGRKVEGREGGDRRR